MFTGVPTSFTLLFEAMTLLYPHLVCDTMDSPL